MPDYNFLNLSPPEFEDISRDLLQKQLGIYFESFTNGRDSGMDLRHSTDKNKSIIVQCKRYKDYSSLLSVLKIEANTVKGLKPSGYILTTACGLTPGNKKDIVKLFSPYIKKTSDVYGRNDLNNLLAKFPEVEKVHFKLWLSSTNILEKILHSKILNQSSFEEENIRETIRVYVENDSYYDALEIIKSKKYVIISGTPGIGKTTLARILVYHFLSNGFEEFIFLSDSINDAYEAYKDNVKQVFLFDDFLGRNFLDKQLSNNEEQRIVRFIEKVSKENNKVLILTTREYILSQAKLKYDIFNNPSLEFAKCVIDLSIYTKLVRAKILYNHLFFSKLDKDHINDILSKKTYNDIIDHSNYSPRIIETITNPDVWKSINPVDFSAKFIAFLDYPESIWKHAYENQISKFSQVVLSNLLTASGPISFKDLRNLIQNFAKRNHAKYGFSFSDIDFKKSIKELENTFITIKKDSINQFVIDYSNPSVQDFLVNYFKDNPDQINDIVQSAIYFNQLFKVFSIDKYVKIRDVIELKKNRIITDPELLNIIIEKIIREFDDLSSSLVSRITFTESSNFQWQKRTYSDYAKLDQITSFFDLEKYPALENFVIEKFKTLIIPLDLNDDDFRYYMDLFEMYYDKYVFDSKLLIETFASKIYFLQQITQFERLQLILWGDFDDFIENNEQFRVKVSTMMYEEGRDTEDYNLDDTLSEIQIIGDKMGIDYGYIEKDLKERIEEFQDRASANYNWENENRKIKSATVDDNKIINDMFEGFEILD